MDGMKKCLSEEFSSINVFNVRGNQRTSWELSKREGGKIFGSGSRTPIAITILVKKTIKILPIFIIMISVIICQEKINW
jgi:predicted helicase